jgi:hypothetical protein
MMQYKDVVREMFARHKGKPAKEIMRMAAAEWQAIKAGKPHKMAGKMVSHKAKGAGLFGDIGHGVDSIASLFGMGLEKQKARKGRKARGGAIDPLALVSGVSSALPVVGDLVSGISDLFSSKPDPDKQLSRDYALREYNRLNGTRYGVEGTHWNVPYGAGLRRKARGGAVSAGDLNGYRTVGGYVSGGGVGNVAKVGKLASGLRGMGGSGGYRTLGSMNRGGSVSGGAASGGAVSAGSLGDILSSALPFMALL